MNCLIVVIHSFMVCFSTLFIVSLSPPADSKVALPDSAFLLLRPLDLVADCSSMESVPLGTLHFLSNDN